VKNRIDMYKGLGAYGTIGMEIALGFVVALFGGGWLDRRFDVAPWCTVVLFVLAIINAIKAVRRAIVIMREVSEREEREEGNPAPLWDEKDREKEKEDRRRGASDPPREPKDANRDEKS
jgi:ATP synthase protein I